MAIVCQNGLISIFINGTKDSEQYVVAINNVSRTSNFLGGNNWGQSFNGEIDDFKIYHRILTQNEILDDFYFIN